MAHELLMWKLISGDVVAHELLMWLLNSTTLESGSNPASPTLILWCCSIV